MLLPAIALAASGLYFETGETLYRKCIATEVFNQFYCLGYITAVSDAIVTYNSIGAHQPVCVTTEPTKKDVRDAVVAYLRDNPTKRSAAASDLVVIALKQSFPCKNAKPD